MNATLRLALLVTRSDVFGGAVVHVRDLAVGLQDNGHDVRVLIGGHGPMLGWFRDAGVRAHSVPHLGRAIRPRADARALAVLGELLRAGRLDLVHVHTAKAGLLGRIAATAQGLPCVYTPHAWPFLDGVPSASRQAYLRIEQAAGRMPASVVNVCRYEQQYALARGVSVPRRHFVVHNGVPDVPARLHGDPTADPTRMVVIARFEPQKDHQTLVRALRRMTQRDWTLDLIGDGPLRADCERQVAAAGLSDRVRFVGEVGDVPERLAGSQLLVLPSRWEGLPLTLLEAMRAGLPVVASDVGGVGEAVEDGSTGILVPRGDDVALATAMDRLVGDAQLRGRMGAAARARYVTQFTLAGMVEETTRVYRTTLVRHAMGQRTPAPSSGEIALAGTGTGARR